MINVTISPVAVQRWKGRLKLVHDAFQRQLATLEEEELDWAPDEGVASAREHLWMVTKSERRLSTLLSRGTETSSHSSYRADDVEPTEMLNIIEISQRNILNWLEAAEPGDLQSPCASDDDGSETIEDRIFHHLLLKTGRGVAIASLAQLIDPSRTARL